MAYEYKASYKYLLAIRFESAEAANNWVYDADEEVYAGVQRDDAEDWVDMYFEMEETLKKFVKLAIEWETVEYFEVYK